MIILVLTAVLMLADGARIQTMDQYTLNTFTKDFRAALLDHVADEWNATVGMANTLRQKTATCNVTVQSQVTLCHTCTKTTCQTTSPPAPLKNVSLPDPMVQLKDPMKYFLSRFADVEHMIGTKAAYYFKAMKFSADTWFVGMVGMAEFMAAPMAVMSGMMMMMGGGMMAGFLNMFGRSVPVDPAMLSCMQSCQPCSAMLLPRDQMVNQLCGTDLTNMDRVIRERVKKLEAIYNDTLDAAHPILSKVELEPSSGFLQPRGAFVTVRLHGQDTRYHSTVAYSSSQSESAARQMALEYWNKFT